MIVRAAQLSRICPACRLGSRVRPSSPSAIASQSISRLPRRFLSEPVRQSKERVEALISGAADARGLLTKKKPSSRRPHRRRGHRGYEDEEPAPWEIIRPTEDFGKTQHGKEKQPQHTSSVLEDVLPHSFITETSLLNEASRPREEQARATKNSRHGLLDRRNLGVDALGQPVEVLVIKNPNKMRSTKKPAPLLKEEMAATGLPLELQDLMPPTSAEPGDTEEVWQNIDEIRPKGTLVIRRREFEKKVKQLIDGFTQEQLKTYFDQGERSVALDSESKSTFPWILNQTPWIAAQCNARLKLTLKQRQAFMIMDVLWKLEIQEDIEGPGRMAVWLNPHVCQVLSRPSNGIVHNLQTNFLDKSKNERLSIEADEGKLSINARKSTVLSILSWLDGVVQSIRSRTVSVREVKYPLSIDLIELLAKITSTAIRYGPDNQEMCVSWLPGAGSNDEHIEDPADVVQRLLLEKQTPVEQSLHCVYPASVAAQKSRHTRSGYLSIHHRDKKGMAWREKPQEWKRYTLPIPKQNDNENLEPRPSADEVKLFKPTARHPDERAEVIATFGHVLHAADTKKAALFSKSGRVLAPVVPHPAALTAITADAPVPSVQKTTIVLHFEPSGPIALDHVGRLPQIRLYMPVNPYSDLSAFSIPATSTLEAAHLPQQIDCLFPGAAVDARFQIRQVLQLDKDHEPLQNFLRASEFNLLQGRLRTPSETSFAIPPHYAASHSGSGSEPPSSMATVAYRFMGLEIQQTIEMEWRGHTLKYSSIEAGQHGGQQQTLSLTARQHGDWAETARLVDEVARGAHFSWTDGHTLMKERSAEQFPWDMIETNPSTSAAASESEADDDGSGDSQRDDRFGDPSEVDADADESPLDSADARRSPEEHLLNHAVQEETMGPHGDYGGQGDEGATVQ